MRLSHPPFRADAVRPALIFAALLFTFAGLVPAVAHAQTTLPVWFDDDPAPGKNGFPVGWGTFTYGTDPGDGLWTVNDLGGVTFAFNVLGVPFTQDDSLYPLNNTLFWLSTTPAGRRIQFTDSGHGAGGFGSGSLDLGDAYGDFLSFEPSWYGSGLTQFAEYTDFSFALGDYFIGATDVPEPGPIAFGVIASIGVIGGMFARKRRR